LHELQREVDVKNVGKKAETATALANASFEATRLDMTSIRTIAVLGGSLILIIATKGHLGRTVLSARQMPIKNYSK